MGDQLFEGYDIFLSSGKFDKIIKTVNKIMIQTVDGIPTPTHDPSSERISMCGPVLIPASDIVGIIATSMTRWQAHQMDDTGKKLFMDNQTS